MHDRSTPLVDVAELAAALGVGTDAERDPALVVLDVRHRLGGPSTLPEYREGHIPGAVFVDLDADLADPPGPAGRHPLPDPQRLQGVLRAAGISAGSRVVAYDHGNGLSAVRAWWLLRWVGMPADRVAVLDGGWAAWCAAGYPVSTEVPAPEPGDLVVVPGSMPTVDADEAGRIGREGVLVDARAAARYRGETEPFDPVAGHIPGAHNVPVLEFVGEDGRWLPPEQLADRFAGVDVAADLADGPAGDAGRKPVAAYCGSGITAAALVLAAEVAGLRPADRPLPLYPGSWSNWVADPSRPVATGPYAPADSPAPAEGTAARGDGALSGNAPDQAGE
ncbi:sulfurtransferase [Pseudonocardia thermophila]|jgi:Rhodanese-related sulfurtransferase|uniref:sulfurtransferase n=1 Tax=Pseudonocardia thermophila TaxID=1848 RepID=UPI00248DCC56|nr:sulfurtransferase [Pseudonocardia thermophila]